MIVGSCASYFISTRAQSLHQEIRINKSTRLMDLWRLNGAGHVFIWLGTGRFVSRRSHCSYNSMPIAKICICHQISCIGKLVPKMLRRGTQKWLRHEGSVMNGLSWKWLWCKSKLSLACLLCLDVWYPPPCRDAPRRPPTGAKEMPALCSWLPSLQKHELNKLAFFVNYSVSEIQLQQQQMA